MERNIINLISEIQNREGYELSRAPDGDSISNMLFILQGVRKMGYPISGFTKGIPPRDLPNIRKNPSSGEYEIWMQMYPSDICKSNFSIALVAILEGKEFIEGEFSSCSSLDELFTVRKDLREPFNKILSVI